MKDSINGWQLSGVSKRTDTPYGNYENPHQERIFVNIMPIDSTKDPLEYRAKYNDHGGDTEEIAISPDLNEVIQAAEDWMRENEPESTGDGQQMILQ